MASGEDIDSGMDSPVPDDTPVKKRAIEEDEDEVCIELFCRRGFRFLYRPSGFYSQFFIFIKSYQKKFFIYISSSCICFYLQDMLLIWKQSRILWITF